MKIEWNKVTWYSKLIAIILFVWVFFLGFHLGKEYGIALSFPQERERLDGSPVLPDPRLRAEEIKR